MTEQSVQNLINKFLMGECTPEEKIELAQWMAKPGRDNVLKKILEEEWSKYEPADTMPVDNANAVLSAILNREASPEQTIVPIRHLWLKRLTVAAVFLALIGTGTYLFTSNNRKNEVAKSASSTAIVLNDAHPGRQKAELTLSDGSKVLLDSSVNGTLTHQGNTRVIGKNGELFYEDSDGAASASADMLYNTLTTSRGQLYPVRLSDGSKVWLNSASSIKFPVTFNTTERRVEVAGEAYFEVAKNPSKPFKVTLNGMEIKVLGTHFNVNGYKDESTVKTTLLEGSLSVTKGMASVLLVPGQQANLKNNGEIDLVKGVDIDEAISWKDGYFHFSNASLEAVLRQLSRWYDVDIVYEKKQPGQFFGGDFERSLNLSQVAKILETSQVHSKIEGKKLIVLE